MSLTDESPMAENEFTYSFPTFNGKPFTLGNKQVISLTLYWECV